MNIFKIKNKSAGFTLIELLVVISIIGFLSSVVLASLQSARERAMDTKIAEDLRQVKVASEMYFGDNNSYNITAFNDTNKAIFAENINRPVFKDLNIFSIKIANAQTSGRPTACGLFDTIAEVLVSKKYLSAVPVHPREDYANKICYKAATSSDGTYFAAYAPLSTSVLSGSGYVTKKAGFVVGNITVPNLNKIHADTTANNNDGYLYTVSGNDIVGTSDIADAVLDITSGSEGVSGSSVDSSDNSTPPAPFIPTITYTKTGKCTSDTLPGGVGQTCTVECPSGTVFLQNGLENTWDGTCIAQ
jgi:prepilin-type N-terminal cleavage/methylation domain-containing protein